jgi:hypothetical protein
VATPTGTVTFLDGTTMLGTGTLNSSGVATFIISTLASGAHSITAAYGGDSHYLAATSAALTQQVSVSVAAPTVLALQRFGFYSQPTTLVLTFSTPLDPARAQDLRNYQLSEVGHHGRTIRLLSARYDPSANAVTVAPARRLSLRATYLLTVHGTAHDGLASTAGALLDGSRSGRPGSDFVTRFGFNALAGFSTPTVNKILDQWAGPGPFGGLQFPAPPVTATAGPQGPIGATIAARHRLHRRGPEKAPGVPRERSAPQPAPLATGRPQAPGAGSWAFLGPRSGPGARSGGWPSSVAGGVKRLQHDRHLSSRSMKQDLIHLETHDTRTSAL